MFESIVEQQRLKTHLETGIAHEQVGHAVLFTGPRGMGKMLLASAYAKALFAADMGIDTPEEQLALDKRLDNGNHPDYVVIEPPENEGSIKIAQIRQLIATLQVKPYKGNLRVIIIRRGDLMTLEAQNALLKSLEEPEPFNVFIITAEKAEQIVGTIRSRCQVMPLEPLSDMGIRRILVAAGESDEQRLRQAIDESGGVPGRALESLSENNREALKEELLENLLAILKGDTFRIFPISEKFSGEKELTLEMMNFLINWFHRMLRCLSSGVAEDTPFEKWQHAYAEVLTFKETVKVLETLFEFMDALQYNINLRLQWESTLLKLQMTGDK